MRAREAAAQRRREALELTAEQRRDRRWNRFFLISAVVAAVMVVPRLFGGDGGDSLALPPDELYGTWVTGDDRYADRFFIIEADLLTLGIGNGAESYHPIRSILGEANEDHEAFDITYGALDGNRVLAVSLYPDGRIRLRNPVDVVWTREES